MDSDDVQEFFDPVKITEQNIKKVTLVECLTGSTIVIRFPKILRNSSLHKSLMAEFFSRIRLTTRFVSLSMESVFISKKTVVIKLRKARKEISERVKI